MRPLATNERFRIETNSAQWHNAGYETSSKQWDNLKWDPVSSERTLNETAGDKWKNPSWNQQQAVVGTPNDTDY